MKKRMAGALTFISVAIVLLVLGTKALLEQKNAESIGVIGGADGPTSIWISYQANDILPFVFGGAIVFLIAAFCVLHFRKKYKV